MVPPSRPTAHRTLNGGMARLNDGVDQVVDGMHQLGTGLRTMVAARINADLARLKWCRSTGHGPWRVGKRLCRA